MSIALAMIRIVIYDLKIESKNSWREKTLECKYSLPTINYLDFTIGEFEDLVDTKVTDSKRLLLEAL